METPEGDQRNYNDNHDTSNEVEDDDSSTCFEDDDIIVGRDESFGDNEDGERMVVTKQHCSRGLETALGIKSGKVKQWVVGKHEASVRSLGYLRKKEGITGYKILISWKNPGKYKVMSHCGHSYSPFKWNYYKIYIL